jgi:hypothetical protein
MSNRLTKRANITYIAAIPAVPPRPGYCVTGIGSVVKYIDLTTLTNTAFQTVPGYPSIVKSHVDATGKTVIDGYLVPIVDNNVKTTVCYPAEPGTAGREAKTITDGQQGWNSGGRGRAVLNGDFEVSFSVPAVPSGAVLCGLASTAATIGQFAMIEHGFYTSGGEIDIYEAGAKVRGLAVLSTDNPTLTIRRVSGVVKYHVGSLSFTSATRSTGTKALTAALYAAGDYIDNPAITKVFSGSSFAPLSLGGDAPASHEQLLLLGSVSGRDAVAGAVPVIALDGIVSVFDMAMAALDRGIYHDEGILLADLTPAVRTSEEFQSGIRFAVDAPLLTAIDTADLLTVSIVEGLIQQSAVYYNPVFFAVINESMTVGNIIEIFIGIDARIDEVLMLGNPTSINMIIEALLRSGLRLSDNSARARSEALQYATNIVTGAVTRYSGFGFASFCNVGQDLYATRTDGLYKVGGDTDNGELLSCLIDFAADDQGNPRTKRLENIFLGITTDGRALAKLKDDAGREIHYRLIQRDSSEARINPAKGVSSRYWHLRLEIEDATHAEIDNIEWVAATGTRRTKR